MFTGIVETTGRIRAVDVDEGGRRLRIGAPDVARELDEGQSVSVNGVCLTVEDAEDEWFAVFLAAETVDRTALSDLEAGETVNLERSLPADGRFDGHVVQGHVDTTTTISAIEAVGEDWVFTFALPAGYERYIVEKGSIALDGVSLTVAERTSESFTVAIVPATYERTTFSTRTSGDPVHVEVDIIAKYVESMLEPTEAA